ncbi:MAG TPA: hypothetical protein VKA40_04945 [Nitrososphaera sp.]|nr:hypothetical protein [Nitrososphaera sp.]
MIVGLRTDVIMGLFMTVLLSVVIVEVYAQSGVTAPGISTENTTTTTTESTSATTGGAIPVPTNVTNPVTGAPLTPTTQQIIVDIQTQCREQGVILLTDCVNVWHESPSTLVINGETLLLAAPGTGPIGSTGTAEDLFGEEFASSVGNYPNVYLWEAVDRFKAQGYTLTSVMLGGQGSQGNPHEFFVVMSK